MVVKKNLNEIVEQFADEAAFLWMLRHNALTAPNYDLDDLAELEERLEANLDALMIDAEDGWTYCESALLFEGEGEIFAASFLATESLDKNKLEKIFFVAEDDKTRLDAIVDAFLWYSFEHAKGLLTELYDSQEPSKQYVAVCVFAEHRITKEALFAQALKSEDEKQVCRAIQAVAELSLKNLFSEIAILFESEHDAIQFYARCAASRFNHLESLEKLKDYLTHPEFSEMAMQNIITAQKTSQPMIALFQSYFAQEELQRMMAKGLGYLGCSKSIATLINIMSQPQLARVAGEGFSSITGIDLIAKKWILDDAPASFHHDSADDVDFDDDLPWPDQAKIATWWEQHNKDYLDDQRYILGGLLSEKQWKYVLVQGNSRQRQFAAMGLAFDQPEEPTVNVRLPIKQQREKLDII